MRKKLDDKTIKALKDANMIKGNFDDYKRIATTYKSILSRVGSKMQAVTETAMCCSCSEITVHRAVRQMKGIV